MTEQNIKDDNKEESIDFEESIHDKNKDEMRRTPIKLPPIIRK